MEAVSLLKKIVLGVQVVGFGAQLVGLASPYWMSAGQGLHMGLWHFCGPVYEGSTPVWFHAVQGLQVVGFCLTLVAAILTGVYMFRDQSEHSSVVCFVDMLICFITGLIVIVSIGTFGAEVKSNLPKIITKKTEATLSWAFGLSATSSILCFGSGIMLAIILFKSRT